MTNGEKLFLVLADELNFSRAAKKSFLSQQCLSDHIQRLEEHYGTQLFVRKPAVALTPAGEALQRTLYAIQNMEAGLEAELSELEKGSRGTLRIGMNYARARLLAPALFEQYYPRYPHVKIELMLEETTTMQKLLERGKLDFFLGVNTNLQPPEKAIPLAKERIYLVASMAFLRQNLHMAPEDLINSEREIDLRIFQDMPFVVNHAKSTTFLLIDQYTSIHNIKLNQVLSVSDYDVMASICRLGHTVFFCPQFILPSVLQENEHHGEEQALYAFSIKDFPYTLRFDLICNETVHYPKFALDCIQQIKDIVQASLERMAGNR